MAHAHPSSLRTPLLAFALLVASVYAAAVAAVGELPRLERPGPVAIGLALDLVVIVPLAFYLLVVRRSRLPAVTVAPAVVLSALAAACILPPAHQQGLRALEVLAVPAELGLLAWIGWRATRAFRAARRDAGPDPLERLRRAALDLTRNERAAAVIASEIAVLYYGLMAWRTRPHAPPGAVAFTYHRRSGHAGIVLAFLLVLTAEGMAVHFLLLSWSPLAAWIFTIGTAYGALWLVADYRATVLRPILVGDRSLLVRAGFRGTLEVPFERIAELRRTPQAPGAGAVKDILRLTFLSSPTRWLVLSEPLTVRGPYGFRRRARVIGFEPDAPEEFDRVLAARRAGRSDPAWGPTSLAEAFGPAGRPGAAQKRGANLLPPVAHAVGLPPRARGRVIRGALAGAGLFLAIMLSLAALAIGLGWIARAGAGPLDLRPWLVLELLGGIPAAMLAGFVGRRVARGYRGPLLLAGLLLGFGLLEAAEILRGAGAHGWRAPEWLAWTAPVATAAGVLLGAWSPRRLGPPA